MFIVVVERGAYCQAFEFTGFEEAFRFAKDWRKREMFCCPNRKVRLFQAEEYEVEGKLRKKLPPK